ncbi:hypothetical protein K458DRAFT_328836 [Lentithecium fluviatile CBS 122367]|uniref:Uncharacterized protein n=1 Tax=Lentithecium fluviatile CBS 122367 TaxID=1168545 RepID=A0A6G1JJX1_9PLEO|nr:hypothetical protein K458DRAFT_328836 [Lentithecium fluviatile CBS 122367]
MPADSEQQLTAPTRIGWTKQYFRRWRSPILMVVLFLVGLAMGLAHCVFYHRLASKIVGSPDAQEEKIRFGTAFAFLSQISLGACVWTCYTQWLWRTVKTKEMTVRALNHAFGAETSVLSLLDMEMLKKLRVGYFMAALAWGLLLPPFFTPATLFVYQSTNVETKTIPMPHPSIANSSVGHKYAYSPPSHTGATQYVDDVSRTFTGPRTILSLISTATASLGEILPVKLPYNTSTHSAEFFAPIVRCMEANASAAELIRKLLDEEMANNDDVVIETENVYYSFVPTFNGSGDLVPISTPRQQSPSNGTNELWMTFLRPTIDASGSRTKLRHFQVCSLYNATYNLHIDRDRGIQNITGSYTINELVPFPRDEPTEISNMAQHAYSAFMWVLCDQLVGKFSWYVNTAFNKSSGPSISSAPQFGGLESQIQRTSLLGSLDLDAFFDLDEEWKLYKTPEGAGILSDQRLRDKNMARNRTLDALIEELSFNISVSLMWNDLLTYDKPTTVNLTNPVNRYAYKSYGLVLPYALANAFTLVIVIIALYSYMDDGVMADKKFQDILRAAEDPAIVHLTRSRKSSITVAMKDDKFVWIAGKSSETVQRETLKQVRTLLRVAGARKRV